MEITEGLKARAFACGTVEELLVLAADNDIELAPEEAELILRGMCEAREGELSDGELSGVAGGQAGCKRNAYEVVYFATEEEVRFIFKPGDVVQAFIGSAIGNETATVRITEREAIKDKDNWKWYDAYKYDRISGSPTFMGDGWQTRDRFEK